MCFPMEKPLGLAANWEGLEKENVEVFMCGEAVEIAHGQHQVLAQALRIRALGVLAKLHDVSMLAEQGVAVDLSIAASAPRKREDRSTRGCVRRRREATARRRRCAVQSAVPRVQRPGGGMGPV